MPEFDFQDNRIILQKVRYALTAESETEARRLIASCQIAPVEDGPAIVIHAGELGPYQPTLVASVDKAVQEVAVGNPEFLKAKASSREQLKALEPVDGLVVPEVERFYTTSRIPSLFSWTSSPQTNSNRPSAPSRA